MPAPAADVKMLDAAVGAVGAFAAAWAGARLGFVKTRNERRLDRAVAWHEDAIQSLAAYEEHLSRMRKAALTEVVIVRPAATQDQAEPPAPQLPGNDDEEWFRPTPETWAALRDVEARGRAALRLADSYTEGRVALECSVALQHTVNLVSDQWIDAAPVPRVRWTLLAARAGNVARARQLLVLSLRGELGRGGLVERLFGRRVELWFVRRRLKKIQPLLRVD